MNALLVIGKQSHAKSTCPLRAPPQHVAEPAAAGEGRRPVPLQGHPLHPPLPREVRAMLRALFLMHAHAVTVCERACSAPGGWIAGLTSHDLLGDKCITVQAVPVHARTPLP